MLLEPDADIDADSDAAVAVVLSFDAREPCTEVVSSWLIERVFERLAVADVARFNVTIVGLIIMDGKPLMLWVAGFSLT